MAPNRRYHGFESEKAVKQIGDGTGTQGTGRDATKEEFLDLVFGNSKKIEFLRAEC